MGAGYSQEDYDRISLQMYNEILPTSCVLPDVGIDESLLMFSGTNSNYALQNQYKELAAASAYIGKLGPALGRFTPIPNAVGLGALVVSMIMELIIQSNSPAVDTYSLLRRVFAEEKASSVRDTMSEYLKRHRMFINNEQQLSGELQRLERQLSGQLTILRNSLLHDGQMSTRGLKIWVNGVSFHLQMMIHEARLQTQTGQSGSDYLQSISNAIDLYLEDLDNLLPEYKNFKIHDTELSQYGPYCIYVACSPVVCYLKNVEKHCEHTLDDNIYCRSGDKTTLAKSFVNQVFSTYEPVSGLKPHFSNIKNNLNLLINQHDSFSLPSVSG